MRLYIPFHLDENERRDAEEEKRANMARPSLLYRDEKKFYDNLLVSETVHLFILSSVDSGERF